MQLCGEKLLRRISVVEETLAVQDRLDWRTGTSHSDS